VGSRRLVPGGYGGDQQDGTREGNPMKRGGVAGAVRAGLDRAGLTGPRSLEFLALDACLMSGVEVTSAFAEITKVTSATPSWITARAGLTRDTLSWLAANPQRQRRDFGRADRCWDATTARPAGGHFYRRTPPGT
jgi:hypothetical protein